VNRSHLKGRLLGEGLKQNRCEVCGLAEWLGRPLSMALHHVNGDGLDNRLENLQLLCPNCHSQTENFAGRGRRRLEAA
jgi:5-methylcytosine-specific restriction endonuclease McrA